MQPIGTKTRFGTVAAVMCIKGERMYMLVDSSGNVDLMPADIVDGLPPGNVHTHAIERDIEEGRLNHE